MIIGIINVILLLTTNFLGLNHDESMLVGESKNDIIEKRLRRIEINEDSLLHIIFKEVLLEDSDTTKLYSVIINDYYEGTIVEIVRHSEDMLNSSLYWNGYVLLNDKKFVIARVYSDYKLDYLSPEQTDLFFMAPHYKPCSEGSSLWFFYILGNIYARYSPESGWIWSDGKPDE